jgi:NADPH:quinone reductase-like Zn-dependent oxidoreductase
VEGDAPQPQPGPGEILVRVFAAGVTPSELGWYSTTNTRSGTPRTGAIPGHEFSGVVAAVGEGADGFAPGQEVYGMNDWFADGAVADYCVTVPESVAEKPVRLTHVEAATVPIGALSAWQGLFDRARLQPGERVLVHGGAGAVGMFAVQLARRHGAHVIATVSAHNREFVTQLGAAQVLDYRAQRFDEVLRGIDVVFDTAGGETLQRSARVLKPGGRLVTIASGDKGHPGFFLVEANRAQLEKIGALLEARELQPYVDVVVPLFEAPAAFTGKLSATRGRGRIAVDIAAAAAVSAESAGLL